MLSISFLMASRSRARQEARTEKQADSAIENQESVAKRALDLSGVASANCSGIGNAPVRGHRLAGPHGADFLRGVVANGEDEIELAERRAWRIRPSSCCADRRWACARASSCLQRLGPNESRGMAAGTVGSEVGPAFAVQNGLGHDGARGIAGAQKQNVVMRLVIVRLASLSCSSVGPQHGLRFRACAGFTARMKALMNLPSTCGRGRPRRCLGRARNSRASSMR